MLATVVKEWPINIGLSSSLMLKIHTGEIFHLEAIYPILNGLRLFGLLVTGMSMSGLFNQKQKLLMLTIEELLNPDKPR
jgi:hypothetical protein